MKFGLIKRNKLGLLLTTILTLSMLFSNIFIVNADAGGTGKFLTINFGDAEGSDCYVVATKSSGQSFTFLANTSSTFSQKVGAGDVVLQAFPDSTNAWIFNYFLDSSGITYDNGDIFKTEKGEIIYAHFEVITYDLYVSVTDERGYGEIWYGENLVAYQYADGSELSSIVPIPFGDSPLFEFVASDGYHLSAVYNGTDYIDLILTEFTQTYQFPAIYAAGYSLEATFSIDGQAEIPTGVDVTVFLSNAGSLTFDDVLSAGGYALGTQYPTVDVLLWEITVYGDTFDGQVLVALRYDENDIPIGVNEEDLRLYKTPSDFNTELYLKCDLNGDGIITGQDVRIISNIAKHPKFIEKLLNEGWTAENIINTYDINEDSYVDDDGNIIIIIDESDIHIVNSMTEPDWIDITYYEHPGGPVDTINNIIYGITDEFSIFRCR